MFIEAVAATGDPLYAATKAGYSPTATRSAASHNMKNPAILAEIRRAQDATIVRLADKALRTLENVLDSPTASERGKINTAKIILDAARSIGAGDLGGKDLHEMTGEELSKAVHAVRAELQSRGDQAKDITPADPTVFD